MKILLAGSTGFLGRYLLESFIKNGNEVIALKRSTSNTSVIDKNLNDIKFYNIDEVTLRDIFKNNEIDVVVNTVTNYGKNNNSASEIAMTNLMFGLELLENSINNTKAFINTDTLLHRNINTYAFSKAQLVDWMIYLTNKNTKIINVKLEHMYGPFGDHNNFICWLVGQMRQNVQKIELTSGLQKRDFIYIDDVVSAYEVIIKNISKFQGYEEFELGTGNSIEVKVFIEKVYKEILKQQNINTKLLFGAIAYRENENMDMKANIQKLVGFGWKPEVSIESGIKKILNSKE